jgi:hypothetical protein
MSTAALRFPGILPSGAVIVTELTAVAASVPNGRQSCGGRGVLPSTRRWRAGSR